MDLTNTCLTLDTATEPRELCERIVRDLGIETEVIVQSINKRRVYSFRLASGQISACIMKAPPLGLSRPIMDFLGLSVNSKQLVNVDFIAYKMMLLPPIAHNIMRVIGAVLRAEPGDCVLVDEGYIGVGLIRRNGIIQVDNDFWEWSDEDVAALGMPCELTETPDLRGFMD